MRYRWLSTVLALGVVLSVAGPVGGALAPQEGSVARAADAADRPNVLLILTDDQRAGTLVGMPNVMSQLVARGTTYPNAFVPTSWCCPSRASLLSGKFAHNSGVWENGTSSAWGAWAAFAHGGEEADTLATRLNNGGYRTGLFGKYLNDTVSADENHHPAGWDEWVAFLGGNYQQYKLSSDPQPVRKDRKYLTDALTQRTIDFIQSTPEDTPFFAYYSPFAPHFPFDPGPYAGATRKAGLLDDVRRSANYPNASTNQPDMTGYPGWMQKLKPSKMWFDRRGGYPPMTIDNVVERQADTLMAVDAGIGRMIATLRQSGRLDNTLIVFVSDNGYAWGEHRLQGKNTPYDVSVRVPLVMRYDGLLGADVTDERVVAANVDVHATILDIAGIKPGRIDGVSTLSSERDGLVMEAMRWAGHYGRPAYCGYRTPDRLYVRYATGEEELYDYTRDPLELDNLAKDPSYRDEKADLRKKTRQACSPTPPGFAWDDRATPLGAPTQVNVTWESRRTITVTWRAPSGVGAQLPEYRVYLGDSPRGRPACERASVRLHQGLRCTILVSGEKKRTTVIVTSNRGRAVAASKPVPLPRRPR